MHDLPILFITIFRIAVDVFVILVVFVRDSEGVAFDDYHEQDYAHTENVSFLPIILFLLEYFRGLKLRSASEGFELFDVTALTLLVCKAKIYQLNVEHRVEHYVFWLQVPMGDILSVDGLQRLDDLPNEKSTRVISQWVHIHEHPDQVTSSGIFKH